MEYIHQPILVLTPSDIHAIASVASLAKSVQMDVTDLVDTIVEQDNTYFYNDAEDKISIVYTDEEDSADYDFRNKVLTIGTVAYQKFELLNYIWGQTEVPPNEIVDYVFYNKDTYKYYNEDLKIKYKKED